MDCNKIRIVEVLTVKTPQSLRGVCDRLRTGFHLTDFSFDAEAEGEWALAQAEGIEYCVSRPFQPIAWEAGGPQAGADCNVCVALIVEEENAPGVAREAFLKERTPRVAQGLADALGEPVIHHLTWRSDRPMVLHERIFGPASLNPPRPMAEPDR